MPSMDFIRNAGAPQRNPVVSGRRDAGAMMNADQIFLAHNGFARLERIASLAAAACSNLYRAWVTARVRRELHELSDRTLQDIGLSRAQIDALFR